SLISGLLPCVVSFRKAEGRVGAKRHSTELAANPVEEHPRLPSPVGNAKREARIALAKNVNLPLLRWLNTLDRGSGRCPLWHGLRPIAVTVGNPKLGFDRYLE